MLADPAIRARLATFGEAKGVEPLVMALNGPLMLVSHKPVRAVADFKGQKIRVPGAAPLHVEPFKKLGASPVSIPLGEVLPALQNKTIDGGIASFNVFTAFKYYDVAKGATYLPGSFLVVGGIVNRAFMKSLGPELEAIVREEARKAETVFTSYGVADVERTRQTWLKNGGETITLPPAEAVAYLKDVTSVVPAVVANNPKMKEDYETLLAVAKKYRKMCIRDRFMFILAVNMIGLIPFTFTVTSHIIVTAALAITVFLTVLIYGLWRHGLHFFNLFVPKGVPIYILPLIVFIEILSFVSRPISHSVRLFANMLDVYKRQRRRLASCCRSSSSSRPAPTSAMTRSTTGPGASRSCAPSCWCSSPSTCGPISRSRRSTRKSRPRGTPARTRGARPSSIP